MIKFFLKAAERNSNNVIFYYSQYLFSQNYAYPRIAGKGNNVNSKVITLELTLLDFSNFEQLDLYVTWKFCRSLFWG